MPANKRRSRNGHGNSPLSSSSTSAAAVQANLKSSNPITKIFNNLNGFANSSNYNGYHPIIANHQVNNHLSPATSVVTANGGIGTSTSTSTSTFTAKQQQQLDRNAFLLTLTKEQLKVECRKRGQKTTGTKTELVSLDFASILFHRVLMFIALSFNLIFVLFIGHFSTAHKSLFT